MRWLAFASALLALAACAPSGQASSPTRSADTLVVYRQLAQCIRSHGNPDFPDPVVDSHGNVDFPPDAPRTSDETRQACQAIADRLPHPAGVHAPTQSQIDQQKTFAECMRTSGFPRWPDPNPDGSMPPPPDDYVSAPQVKETARRCRPAG